MNVTSDILHLSIIIINWNTRNMLAQCLESVAADIKNTQLEIETLVVDNASTDDSVELVKRHFPWVRLFENKKNVGFAAANNQAIEQSAGRYVLLLNPDTEVKTNALPALFDFMEQHPQAGAAGSMLLNSDGTLQASCYPSPTLSREFWRLLHMDVLHPYGVYHMAEWNVETPRAVDVLQGASLLLRREALAQVGLLDDSYFMYTEEVDLCYRLQKGGWSLFWVPQSQVIHYGGQSTKQVATKMFLCLYQSKFIFIRKHYGRGAAQAYKLILALTALIRLAVSPLVWLERNPKRQRHLTLARHYWSLLKQLPKM